MLYSRFCRPLATDEGCSRVGASVLGTGNLKDAIKLISHILHGFYFIISMVLSIGFTCEVSSIPSHLAGLPVSYLAALHLDIKPVGEQQPSWIQTVNPVLIITKWKLLRGNYLLHSLDFSIFLFRLYFAARTAVRR